MTDQPFTPEDEVRAMALTSFALMNTLLSALERRGVLDAPAIQAVFDAALMTLEKHPGDRVMVIARHLIEGMTVARGQALRGKPES